MWGEGAGLLLIPAIFFPNQGPRGRGLPPSTQSYKPWPLAFGPYLVGVMLQGGGTPPLPPTCCWLISVCGSCVLGSGIIELFPTLEGQELPDRCLWTARGNQTHSSSPKEDTRLGWQSGIRGWAWARQEGKEASGAYPVGPGLLFGLLAASRLTTCMYSKPSSCPLFL